MVTNNRAVRLGCKVLSSRWILFCVALILRLVVAGQLVSTNSERFYLDNEPSRIAWAMVSGHGFSSPWPNTPLQPTAQQPPLYPWLLASVFRVVGAYSKTSLWIVLALNSIFSALTAVMIVEVGGEHLGRLAGLVGGWLWCCWIYEIVVPDRVWESSLSALLLLLGLWLLRKIAATDQSSPWIAFGVIAGLSALSNTTLLGIFVCFWLWLWMNRAKRNPLFIRRWVTSVAVCIVLLLPWTVRNYVTFGRLIPIRDNLGLELWIGNHTGVTHLYNFRPDFPLYDPTEYNRLGEISFMESRGRIARDFIVQHPRQFAVLFSQRLIDFWIEPTNTLWWFVSSIAWLGLILSLWRSRLEALPEALTLVVFPIIYYITHTWSTYRNPIEPMMLLLCGYVVIQLFNTIGYWVGISPRQCLDNPGVSAK